MQDNRIELTVVTYDDIFASSFSRDKFGKKYKEKAARLSMDESDMKALGIKDRVELSNENGSVVLYAGKSTAKRGHPGLAYMPLSLYSGILASGDARRIKASASKTEKEVQETGELLKAVTSAGN